MHVTPFDKLANNELIVHPSYTRIPVHLLLGYCIRSPIDRVATTQLKVSIFVCQLRVGNVHAIEKSRDSSPIEMVNLKSNRYQYCLLACLPTTQQSVLWPMDVTIRVKSVLYVQIPINYP